MATTSNTVTVEALIRMDARKKGERFSVSFPRAIQLMEKRTVRVIPQDKERFADYVKGAR